MKAIITFAGLFLFALTTSSAQNRYPTKLPPSAQLHYTVKASRSGFSLNGQAEMDWRVSGAPPEQTYSIKTETRADLFGKILEANSNGVIDAYGLAPLKYEEKPRKKQGFQTTFDRSANLISFSESPNTETLRPGEQDRSSAVWQLMSIARASPKKFVPQSKWTFWVAGRKSTEKWTFTVNKKESISTAFGKISTVHLTKSTVDDKDQRIEVWLAPSKEWYPVRIKSEDPDGDTIEQNLARIELIKED